MCKYISIIIVFPSLLSVVWDEKAVEKLLDRSQVTEVPDQDNEDEEKGGMNEYLRSFKVASYQIKTTAEEVETNRLKRLPLSLLEKCFECGW